MALEYYFGSPAFQSGIISFSSASRNIFALFFYANAIFCIADFSRLNFTQLNFLYPYLNIIGIIIFTFGVLLRYFTLIELLRLPANKLPKSGIFQTCRHPRYLATIIQTISIPMIFSSYLGLILSLTLGLFLIYKVTQSEERTLIKQYKEDYINYQQHVPFIIPKLSRFSLVKPEPKPKPKKPRQ
jgi:protein-S-isoprenylcysteine O-methyltransferase Ste14